MPPVRKISRTAVRTAKTPMQRIVKTFEEWTGLREQTALLDERIKSLRDSLTAEVETQGYEDDKGHMWLDFPSPVGLFKGLKREKRISRTLDPDRAETLLTKKGLLEECSQAFVRVTDSAKALKVLEKAGLLDGDDGFEVQMVLDEDAITKAYFQDKLTERELDSLFVVKESFAFIPVKV